ncbi:ABC transporter permease, partial [Mesorhizobium sp.]
GPDATPEMKADFARQLGLDRPLVEQYLAYVKSILSGSFGLSYVYRRDALGVVVDNLAPTLTLMGAALAIATIVGVLAGAIAAINRKGTADRLITVLSSGGLCIPAFFLGLVLMLIFSIELRWLPTSGAGSWKNLILPAVTVAASNAAVLARYTRVALAEALDSPYVMAAEARDIPFWRILLHHAAPNAAIPVLTVLGMMVGALVTGSIVVEQVFSWPGIGNLFITSIGNRDIPVVQAIVVLAGAAMILTNLAVEFLYVLVDPRTRRSDH